MPGYRPDRVVRVLTTFVTIIYFWLAALAILVLVGLPAVRLLAGTDPSWSISLTVPTHLEHVEEAVRTHWGEARLEVEEAQGSLRLPIGILPWWLFVLVWTYIALIGALMLLFLHQLRRLFQRVRDGAPFDAANARRLRSMGLVAIAFAVLNGVAETVASVVVRQGLIGNTVRVPAGLSFDLSLVFFGLVLLALAEIFRRGTELEDEQALVI